jgi:hypothetical protein
MMHNKKICFIFLITLGWTSQALDKPLENIDETGLPLGEVCEGEEAKRLMKQFQITPQNGEIFFAPRNTTPYKFRENAGYTSSQPAGTSTSIGVQGGFTSPLTGFAEVTSYTETVHHPRDRYFNNFNRLRTSAIVNTAVNHFGAMATALLYFASSRSELKKMKNLPAFIKIVRGTDKIESYCNLLQSTSVLLLSLAASCAYLGCKNMCYYATVPEQEYLDARTKTAQKEYYKYDNLARECRRPGYYRNILAAVAASAITTVISASIQ